MDLLEFFITVSLISASGALAPGPLFFSTISVGMKKGSMAGLRVSIGHTAVEFPLVILIAFGLGKVLSLAYIKTLLGIIGGVAIILLGILEIKNSIKSLYENMSVHAELIDRKNLKNFDPFLIGLTLSLFNPFFLLWWATVGLVLIAEALEFLAFYGILIMYVFHVWIDYAWLIFITLLAYRVERILNSRAYYAILALLGFILVSLGINFILKSTLGLAVIPF
ncbi:MAG: LysE family transporter [Candidatus Bathyarchaeia archaeon]